MYSTDVPTGELKYDFFTYGPWTIKYVSTYRDVIAARSYTLNTALRLS